MKTEEFQNETSTEGSGTGPVLQKQTPVCWSPLSGIKPCIQLIIKRSAVLKTPAGAINKSLSFCVSEREETSRLKQDLCALDGEGDVFSPVIPSKRYKE